MFFLQKDERYGVHDRISSTYLAKRNLLAWNQRTIPRAVWGLIRVKSTLVGSFKREIFEKTKKNGIHRETVAQGYFLLLQANRQKMIMKFRNSLLTTSFCSFAGNFEKDPVCKC